VDADGPARTECFGGRGSRGTGGEDIIDQEHERRNDDAIAHQEGAPHRDAPLGGVPLGLRPGGDGTTQEVAGRKIERSRDAKSEHLRLVEPSLRETAS
jgi:hypothetical protein